LTLIAGKPAPTGHESLLNCYSRTAPYAKKQTRNPHKGEEYSQTAP